MTVSCNRAVTGSWYSVRRNGWKKKVTEVKGGVSAIKRGRKQRGIHKKETERTEINKIMK
jgi:hypothetical protein